MAPPCISGRESILIVPCKEYCESVKRNCQNVIQALGGTWPEFLKCSNFPPDPSRLTREESILNENNVCLSENYAIDIASRQAGKFSEMLKTVA